MQRAAAGLVLLVALACGAPATSSDAAVADAGPVDCTGTFGPGVVVFDEVPAAFDPALTADERSLVYVADDLNVWEATRASTTERFSSHRAIGSLRSVCLDGPHALSGVDVSMDGLRVYASCRQGATLYALHRISRDASEELVLDGPIATSTSSPAVTAGELELYDEGYDFAAGRWFVVHASRASVADAFPDATPLAGLETALDVARPDLSPDGLTLYGSTPRGTLDTPRHLVAFTRASTTAPFEARTETPLGVEGTLNVSYPEISASCRGMYYSAADATGIHIYVARR